MPETTTMNLSSYSSTVSGESNLLPLIFAFLAASVHFGLGLFFYSLDIPEIAHWDMVGAAIHLSAAAFIWRGWRFTGIWIMIGSAAPHAALVTIALGLDSGWAYYLVAVLVAPLIFFQAHPRHMVASVALCLTAAAFGVLGSALWGPWVLLDPAVLGRLHSSNLMGAIGSLAAGYFVIIHMHKRTRRQIARLRKEVREARQLGQYTLGEKLGAGGMGQVYRANHALLRRPAAIKLIRDGEVSAENLRRFEREVQLTSELTHPNTIAIYDYGHTPEGVFYYVMEYLDGMDLQALVRQYGPQPANRVIHILRQSCEALHEAHAHGLVHRDIKPANIVLSRRGERPDVVKVLDFGLVRDVSDSDKTSADTVSGTPAYLSPEAITDPENVGPASDLYALGAVAYFLLTGKQVFDGKTPAAILVAHINDAPPDINERAAYDMPERLAELVMRCLEKDTSDRPGSALDMRRALEDIAASCQWNEAAAHEWWSKRSATKADGEQALSRQPDEGTSPVELTVAVDVRSRQELMNKDRAIAENHL